MYSGWLRLTCSIIKSLWVAGAGCIMYGILFIFMTENAELIVPEMFEIRHRGYKLQARVVEFCPSVAVQFILLISVYWTLYFDS